MTELLQTLALQRCGLVTLTNHPVHGDPLPVSKPSVKLEKHLGELSAGFGISAFAACDLLSERAKAVLGMLSVEAA